MEDMHREGMGKGDWSVQVLPRHAFYPLLSSTHSPTWKLSEL